MDINEKFKTIKIAGREMKVGPGGEVHQRAGHNNVMTTQQGCPVGDNQNSLHMGPRGPTALEDHISREKIFHFDHERIPERVVHARGFGVHGYFETYESLSDVTCADLFQRAGEKTPVFVRFSTVIGNKGSFDLARDVRGFACKFYTKEGNWDLVANNIPVFFVQDAIKFIDLIHAAKPEPDRAFPQAQTAHDNFWDFISLTPESMHMIMWIMSDRTIPRSFRFMEGFGVHTFRLINKEGKATFVKFIWKPRLGLQSVLWNEAVKINGADPDFHRRDLWFSIQNGEYPQWELGLQLFDEEFAEKFDFDVLDSTKLIPEEICPIRRVGRLVLNKCVDNFFAETEQVAFCTQNIVPGIDFTEDPLLQGRNFSYLDTQLKRLGSPNFTQIPINAPKTAVKTYNQDGHMTMCNPKGRVNYEPNSWDEDEGPRECCKVGFKSFPEKLSGQKVRMRSPSFADHYSQALQFYKSQTPIEQTHMMNALSFELSKVNKMLIRERMISHILNIDKDLAEGLAKNLGVDPLPEPAQTLMSIKRDLPIADSLSILKNPPPHFSGRRVGIVVSQNYDESLLDGLLYAIKKEMCLYELVSLHAGFVCGHNGAQYRIDQKVDGAPSVIYDSIALVIADTEKENFAKSKPFRDFVSDAVAHFKFIAYTPNVKSLITEFSHLESCDEGMIELDAASKADTFIKECRKLRFWNRA